MLPSKGYFKSLCCPFHYDGICKRPYCHFRHFRKDGQSFSESSIFANGISKSLAPASLVSNSTEPPTENTEIAMQSSDEKLLSSEKLSLQSTSAQTIVRPSTSVPSYKPTPISELRKRHIPVTFNPDSEKISSKTHVRKKKSYEYVPKSINGNVPVADYKPTPSNLPPASKPRNVSSASSFDDSDELTRSQVEKMDLIIKNPNLKPSEISTETKFLKSYIPSSYSSDISGEFTPSQEEKLDLIVKNPHLTPMSLGITSKSMRTTEISDDFDIDGISKEIDMLGKILAADGMEFACETDCDTKCEELGDSDGDNEEIGKPAEVKNSDLEDNNSLDKQLAGSNKTDDLESNKYTKAACKLNNDLKRCDDKNHESLKSKSKTSSSDSKHDKSSKHSGTGKHRSDKHVDSKKKMLTNIGEKKDMESEEKLVKIEIEDKQTESSHHSKDKNSSSKSSDRAHKPHSSSNKHDSNSSKSSERSHKSHSSSSKHSHRSSSHKSEKSDKHSHRHSRKDESSKDEKGSHSASRRDDLKKDEKPNKNSHSDSRKEKFKKGEKSDKSSHSNSRKDKSSKDKQVEKRSHSNSSKHENSEKRSRSDSHSEKSHKNNGKNEKHSRSDTANVSSGKESKKSTSDKYMNNNNNNNNESENHQRKRKHSSDRKHHSSSTHSKRSKHDSKEHHEKDTSKALQSSRHNNTKHSSKRDSKVNDSDHSSDIEEIVKPLETILIDTSEESSDMSRDSSPAHESVHETSDNDQEVPEPHSEPVNQPEPEPEPESSYMDLPKVKSKTRIAHNASMDGNCSLSDKVNHKKYVSPSEALLDRYHKAAVEPPAADTMHPPYITPQAGQKVRIAHVPNVSSLLNSKSKLLSSAAAAAAAASKPSGSRQSTDVSNVNKSIEVLPIVASVKNCAIPLVQRQAILGRLYDLYKQIYNSEVAKIKAVNSEKELSTQSKHTSLYKNKVVQLCLSLKREIKILTGRAPHELPPEEDPLIPQYTYGKPLYDCFLQYKLENLYEEGIPVEHPSVPNAAKMKVLYNEDQRSFNKSKNICINCGKTFTIDENNFSIERKCTYHLDRKQRRKELGGGRFYDQYWDCCKQQQPCIVSEYHVRDNVNYDLMPGFVKTPPCPSNVNFPGIYAIDCEMCYTTEDSELTRVTVVNHEREVVYESYCKPLNPIIDYCTRFSGVEERHLVNVTRTLKDIQNDLLKIFNEKSILVGHSIGNDLKALKIIHTCVVDTSVIFVHKYGSNCKRKLRDLTQEFLRRAIQEGVSGHCSEEDALAALDLMIYKIKEDRKAFKPRTIISLETLKK